MSSESFEIPEKCRGCISAKTRVRALDTAAENIANAPEMVALMFGVGDGLAKLDPENWESSPPDDMERYMDAVTEEQDRWRRYGELGKATLTTIVDACSGSVTRQDVDIEGLETGDIEVYPVQVTDCGTSGKTWNDFDWALQEYLDSE